MNLKMKDSSRILDLAIFERECANLMQHAQSCGIPFVIVYPSGGALTEHLNAVILTSTSLPDYAIDDEKEIAIKNVIESVYSIAKRIPKLGSTERCVLDELSSSLESSSSYGIHSSLKAPVRLQ